MRDDGRRGVVGRETGDRGGKRLRELDCGPEAVSIAGFCLIGNVSVCVKHILATSYIYR